MCVSLFFILSPEQKVWTAQFGTVAFLDATHGTNSSNLQLYGVSTNATGRQGVFRWSTFWHLGFYWYVGDN